MDERLKKELEEKLSALIGELTPVPCEPEGIVPSELVCFDGTEPDNTRWKALMVEHLASASRFEIHCWSDETEAIALALRFGAVKPYDWKHGTVIEGEVTEAFRAFLLDLPAPGRGADGYNKMTPFFTVFLDNGFSSEHYGTENVVPLG